MKVLIKIAVVLAVMVNTSCTEKSTQTESPKVGTFGFDVEFLRKHKEILVLGLSSSPAKVLVVGDYQGRVMTSTADGDLGNSYGWINYDLIGSGKIKPHMNAYGGEDRFWLGPEGGQFALFFKKGAAFDFEHWQTPPLIDSEPFELISSDSMQATFVKSAEITNYHGSVFEIKIRRQIRLLTNIEIETGFGISVSDVKSVGFQSLNSITNTGEEDWNKQAGLPSIWILGMFKPGPQTIIIIPFEKSDDPTKVTEDYFGTIPSDRIKMSENLLLLSGDGKFRSKVGIAPSIAKNIVGSYDGEKHILTLVKFDLEKAGDYVNSKWEMQKTPFAGDVVNAYNDGRLEYGGQLGPFYELESSSPARELKKADSLSHRHITVHLEGSEEALGIISEKCLGVSLRMLQIK